MEFVLEAGPGRALHMDEMTAALAAYLDEISPRRLLIIPPDLTRVFSRAGELAAFCYAYLKDRARVEILPALGSHLPMEPEALARMFPGVPGEAFLTHHWRRDVRRLGQVPGDFVRQVSGGLMDGAIDVEVNERLLSGGYDAILSLGQVVPHEVVGMANYTKNILVGVGGSQMIHRTHFLGAVCGMEQAMGRDFAPVRRVFDYAHETYLKDLPLMFGYTVIGEREGRDQPVGFFLGAGRAAFERAVVLSQRENIIRLERPAGTIVCTLDPEEFQSTWVGNKAVYRTRMAIRDGGRLVVFAPGVRMLGEDPQVDSLLRQVGYVGRDRVLRAVRENLELAENLSAAAHLIHGSTEGRFQVAYCAPLLGREAVEREARYLWLDPEEGQKKYRPDRLSPGWNRLPDGEEVYFIRNPALGLWQADLSVQ